MASSRFQGDEVTTVNHLKDRVKEFISDRDWGQFHDPKNVSMALASEVGELLDLFRWVRSEDSFQVLEDDETRDAVRMEIADIAMFLVDFASICNIDLTTAIDEKMQINASRYPVEQAKGVSKKYTELGKVTKDPQSL
ncbi:MAG: nucleotide pyrophosphohydrolase [Rubripirellula sp.]|nr:nucleotide pyrophosphohydrolase [Rubripirellula sp.]